MHRRAAIPVALGVGVGALIWWCVSKQTSDRDFEEVPTLESHSVDNNGAARPSPKAPVPQLKNNSPAPPALKVTRSPGSPDYDVVKLMSATGTSAFRAFEAESRDPAWAVPRERDIARFAVRDIEKANLDVELVRTECRHSTCILVLKGADEKVLDQANLLLQYVPLANVYSPVGTEVVDGAHYFVAALAFEAAERNDESWAQNYETYRTTQLARRREKGVPADFPPIPED